MALAAYENLTRFYLHDPAGQAYATSDIDTAINVARRQVAGDGECVRALLSGGTILALSISSGGSGYAGTISVTFSGPGSQTFAVATQSGGVINSITLQNGGWGWVTPPTITVTGSGGGSGAVINATVDNSASTVALQEVIQYSTLDTLAQAAFLPSPTGLQPSGIKSVVGINSIACQWGPGTVYKPTLRRRSWSWFQANCRVYSIAAMNFPAYWAKYGRGVSGSFYLFPIPAQVLSLDVDAICLPIDLIDDTTVEAIPSMWTDAVAFYAAYMCYLNSQRAADAERMFLEYRKFMARAQKANEASAFVPDQYNALYGVT